MTKLPPGTLSFLAVDRDLDLYVKQSQYPYTLLGYKSPSQRAAVLARDWRFQSVREFFKAKNEFNLDVGSNRPVEGKYDDVTVEAEVVAYDGNGNKVSYGLRRGNKRTVVVDELVFENGRWKSPY